MRSTGPAIAVVLGALLVASGCEVGDSAESSSRKKNGTRFPSASRQATRACEILTKDVAEELLGDVAAEPAFPPYSSTDDVAIGSCVRATAESSRKKARSLSLLVRAARTESGARSNAAVFAKQALPRGARSLSGYGQAAFWNPAFGQLNILSEDNWYVLSSGPVDPTKHTFAETRKFADAIKDKL